jgi:hypothetical protein
VTAVTKVAIPTLASSSCECTDWDGNPFGSLIVSIIARPHGCGVSRARCLQWRRHNPTQTRNGHDTVPRGDRIKAPLVMFPEPHRRPRAFVGWRDRAVVASTVSIGTGLTISLSEPRNERGLPYATDEAVRNYLRGALENLILKIRRNYKVAIPVWYVEERRMQLLLPRRSEKEGRSAPGRAVMFTAWTKWDQRLWREHDRRRERMLRHAQ